MAHADTSPRTIRLLTAVLLFATFAAGTITGAGVIHWLGVTVAPPPHGPPPFLSAHVMDELNLSPAQRDKAYEIGERLRPRVEAVVRESFPKIRAAHEESEREFRAILTPEQQARFDRWKATWPPRPPHAPMGPPHMRGLPPPGAPPPMDGPPPMGGP